MLPLRCDGCYIAFQEVPDETTLIFNVTGCTHKCAGCHSSYLADYYGDVLAEELVNKLNTYKQFISCVCFMGGDQNIEELIRHSNYIHSLGLKVCMYFGCDSLDDVPGIIEYVDYIKVGPYIENCGGLDSNSTNQVFYKIIKKNGLYFTKDITYKFRKKE